MNEKVEPDESWEVEGTTVPCARQIDCASILRDAEAKDAQVVSIMHKGGTITLTTEEFKRRVCSMGLAASKYLVANERRHPSSDVEKLGFTISFNPLGELVLGTDSESIWKAVYVGVQPVSKVIAELHRAESELQTISVECWKAKAPRRVNRLSTHQEPGGWDPFGDIPPPVELPDGLRWSCWVKPLGQHDQVHWAVLDDGDEEKGGLVHKDGVWWVTKTGTGYRAALDGARDLAQVLADEAGTRC